MAIKKPNNDCFSKGEKLTLIATVSDAEGKQLSADMVKWRSLNPDVAAVTGEGVVNALSAGRVTIEAS